MQELRFSGTRLPTNAAVLGGSLVVCAVLLIALARAKQIALRRSVVTDEIAMSAGKDCGGGGAVSGRSAARRIMEEKQRSSVTLAAGSGRGEAPDFVFDVRRVARLRA